MEFENIIFKVLVIIIDYVRSVSDETISGRKMSHNNFYFWCSEHLELKICGDLFVKTD